MWPPIGGQRHLLVAHQGIRLQSLAQRREIGERLERGAGLALRLRGAVELARRVGESAGHGENGARLVVEDDGRALHPRPHPQLDADATTAGAVLGLRLGLLHEHDVVGVDAAPHRRGQVHHPAVGKARFHAVLVRSENDRGAPVHVVERHAHGGERLLPGLALRPAGGFDLAHGVADVGFGAAPFDPAGAHLVLRKAFLQRRFGGLLDVGADRRVQRDPGGREIGEARGGARLAGDMVEEVVAGRPRRDPVIGHHARQPALGDVDRAGVRRAVLLHAGEHVGEPLLGAIGMPVGAVIGRALGERGEHGALGERQGRRRLAEIAAGGELDAVGAAAEIDGVEIGLENVGLGERVLDLRGEHHLAQLALIGDVVADQEILHHLLGDGRSALGPARAGEVRDHGADQAALVDALVLVEALVLGGDERLLDMDRNVAQRHPDAAIAFRQVGEALALAVEHAAGPGGAQRLEAGGIRQVGHRLVVETDDGADVDGRVLDVLVLAELAVDHDHVVELEPVQRLDLRGEGAGVVHRGLDQVVDVDRLDVEGLAHVGAAVPHDAGDRGGVGDGIEAGVDRVRARGHLTERQKCRQNLDEKHIHEDGGPFLRPPRIRQSEDGFFRVAPPLAGQATRGSEGSLSHGLRRFP